MVSLTWIVKNPEPSLPIHPDPYRASHKAIRVAMGRLVESAGRTDFGDVASLERFRAELEDVVQMLATHARIEVQYLDPLLGAHDHAQAASIQHAHTALERKLHGVSGGIHALEEILDGGGGPSEARERGHAFYLELTRFTADYLHHIADEEEQALPSIRRHVDDAALEAALSRARQTVEAGEAARMTGLMIASVSHPERVALLRASGSEELRWIARMVLTPADWKALEDALDD